MGVPTYSPFVAEFVGTFLLVFTVVCNVLSGDAVWGGVSIACVLTVSIYALGGISGANFNPAVTLSLVLTGKKDLVNAAMYMLCQILGGLLGGAFASMLFPSISTSLGPAHGFDWVSVLICEAIYTMMLCFVVLNVACTDATSGNEFYGLAIGFVIVAGAYGAGAVSGGCFNPAVALGINKWGSEYTWPFLYLLFEFIGAALAALFYKLIRAEPGSALAKLLSEFLGTFMLVITVSLNVLGSSPAGAFSIAASLMCMIYALGDVSGANFNPAVSIAIAISKKNTWAETGMYIAVQLVGGICGTLTTFAIYGKAPAFEPSSDGKAVGIAEAVFTFVLCYIVLCVAVSDKTKSKTMFGFAIGACVTVGGNAVGTISGGHFNPAVTAGLSSGYGFAPKAGALFAYWLYQLIGAILAAFVFMVTHADGAEAKEAKENPLLGDA